MENPRRRRSAEGFGCATRSVTSLAFALVLTVASDARAQEPVTTRVVVRVLAHDAKLIGTGMGGVRVTIRETESGAVLAEGMHEGGTGNTELIMKQPRARGVPIFDTEGAAGFVAALEIVRPTRIEIVAEGPLGIPDAVQRASKTLLIVPGEHLTGQGVVLELNGFAIEIELPADRQAGAGSIDIRVRVRMLCGCPIEPGGTWDANRLEVTARLLEHGRAVAETLLRYGGETSIFLGTLEYSGTGQLELEVIASDPDRANFGRAVRTIALSSK